MARVTSLSPARLGRRRSRVLVVALTGALLAGVTLASSSCLLFSPVQCADALCGCLPGPPVATRASLRAVVTPASHAKSAPPRPTGDRAQRY